VRWNLESETGLALGASFFATPCEEMINRVAELGSAVVERRHGPAPRNADSFAAWAADEFAVQMAGHDRITIDEADRQYVEVLIRRPARRDEDAVEGPLSGFAAKPKTRLLVIGEGGAGKTTMLLHLAWSTAEQRRDTQPGGGPFYARLNLVEAGAGRTFESLLAILGEPAGMSAEQMQDAWLRGQRDLLFLLDGLNEVADDAQPAIATALRRLLGERRHRYIITSRPTPAADGLAADVPDLERVVVVRLAEDQIREYLAGHGVEGLYEDFGEQLRGLARNPFMLWALVQACTGHSATQLPSNVGGLYRLFVDEYIFGRREPAKRPPPTRYDYAGAKRPALAAVALGMTEMGQTRIPIDDDLEDRVAASLDQAEHRAKRRRKVMPKDWDVEGFLHEVAHNGIVVRRSQTLAFMHESVQEYFAAAALENQPVEAVAQRLPELVWRLISDDGDGDGFKPTPLDQVVVMLAGLLDDATPLLVGLSGRNTLLAARCLGAATAVELTTRQNLLTLWTQWVGRRDVRYRVIGCRCLAAARAADPEATEALLAASTDYSNQSSFRLRSAAYNALAETRAPSAARPLFERALSANYLDRDCMRALTPLLDAELTLVLVREWHSAGDDGTRRRRIETIMAAAGVPLMKRLLPEVVARAEVEGDEEAAVSAGDALGSIEEWRRRAEEAYEVGRSWGRIDVDEVRRAGERERAAVRERLRRAPTEEVIEALRHPESNVRNPAATVLSERPDARSARALVSALLTDPSDFVAGRFADALKEFGSQPDLVADLLGMLARFEPVVELAGALPPRERGKTTITDSAHDAIRSVLERAGLPLAEEAEIHQLEDGWAVRVEVRTRFVLFDREPAIAVLDLQRRARAARALAALDPERARESLAAALAVVEHNDQPSVISTWVAREEQLQLQLAAVDVLAASASREDVPVLVDALRRAIEGTDTHELVRRLISALGVTRSHEAAPTILEALLRVRAPSLGSEEAWGVSSTPGFSEQIHETLQLLADAPMVLPWLRVAMRERGPDERIAAAVEFARWHGEPSTLVDVAVSDQDARVRIGAAARLRWYAGSEAIRLLTVKLATGEPSVRRAAAEALANIRDESAVAPLCARLDDPDPVVRLAVAAAVISLAEGDPFSAAAAVIERDAVALADDDAAPAAIATLLLADAHAVGRFPAKLLRSVALDGRLAAAGREIAWEHLNSLDESPASAAYAALEAGRYEDAVREFTAILPEADIGEQSFYDRYMLWWRGVAHAELRQFEEAIADMSAYPYVDADERAQFAVVLARAGHPDEALEEVASVVEEADQAGPLIIAGWAAYLANDLERALDVSTRAAAIGQGADGLRAALNVAVIHVAAGRFAEAEAAYETALRRVPDIDADEAAAVLEEAGTDLDDLVSREPGHSERVAAFRTMLNSAVR
jgi:HEAT repeat protein